MDMNIYIIWGFLGSGKTTLINYLLSSYLSGKKVVVNENESGTESVDSVLLRSKNYQVKDLNSGCICCTLRQELPIAIKEIEISVRPDILLIEPSGLASLEDLVRIPDIRIDGIISLPLNTFFTTNKKTYILAITKKKNKTEKQSEPVFGYLVSEIGESRDIYRFDIEQNDLKEAVGWFKQFKNAKKTFKFTDKRLKVQPIEKFDAEINWSVERWWTKEEQIELQNKLHEQRLAISRDLHDNIGAQLTFIISSVDSLKYAFADGNPKLEDKLNNISSFTKETIYELRDTIWAMNKEEITIEDLKTRISNFIEIGRAHV